MSDPDVQLMLAFANGQEEAFVELYRRHRDRIVSFTRRMLGNQAEAEEAAQDVFLKLYRTRASYEPRSRFSTFLYRIAANHCMNLRARVERKLIERDRAVEDAPGPRCADQHEQLAQSQLRDALESALGKLPERQRAALLLVHYEGLSYRETAESIEVSEAAVKSLIHRARTALVSELGPWIEQLTEVSMRCEQARALLEARYELERSAELTAHLAECRECAALDAHEGALDGWLALSEAAVARPGFDTRFFARLEQEKARARRRRWSRWAWALAPAAAATAALLWLRPAPVPAPGVAGGLPAEVAPDDVALAVDLELVEQLEVAGKLDEVEAYDVLSELDDGELERMAQEAR